MHTGLSTCQKEIQNPYQGFCGNTNIFLVSSRSRALRRLGIFLIASPLARHHKLLLRTESCLNRQLVNAHLLNFGTLVLWQEQTYYRLSQTSRPYLDNYEEKVG